MTTLRLWLPLLFATAFGYTALIPDGVPSFERDPFNYIVALKSAEPSDDALLPETPSERVVMTAADGMSYACSIPDRHPTDAAVQIIGKSEKSPFDFLAPLGTACLSRIERWWTYEFCFGRRIRQYHDDQDQAMKEDYTLGVFDPTAELDTEIREDVVGGKSVKYIRQIFPNGDVCKETETARSTEVRFLCEEQSQLRATLLASIQEGPTCQYVVNVNSPLLCQHPAFKTQETTRVIVCDRIAAMATAVPETVEEVVPDDAKLLKDEL